MLRALAIDNIVLIEKMTLDFNAGMTALTGETGAGKSIILDSLAMVLGARADIGLIRAGADGARVTAEFDVPREHPLWAEIDADPAESLILSRQISREGKSRATLSDRPVSLEILRKIGASLVDIHSQFETHALLEPAQHRALLDRALPDQNVLDKTESAWQSWQDLISKRDALAAAQEKARLLQDQWRADLDVLEELDPQPGEEDELLEKRQRAQKASRTHDAYLECIDALSGSDEAADKALNRAWKVLSRLPEEAGLTEAQTQIDQAIALVRDAADRLYELDRDLAGMQSAESIDDRLHELRGAARRLNVSCDALPEKRVELTEKLASLAQDDAALGKLETQVSQAREAYIKTANTLSKARQTRAKDLAKRVCDELPPLKLERARFDIDIQPLEEASWSGSGVDRVHFMAAMNTGQTLSPLHKTASGGELSRLLLAIKMVLAGGQVLLVFDEIDQGIGGATAAAVGDRLRRLADHHQVIVVTHSAQVAASGHAHYVVQKAADGKTTRVAVTELKGTEARRDEVARMLAGSTVTNEARAAADKLLERAAS